MPTNQRSGGSLSLSPDTDPDGGADAGIVVELEWADLDACDEPYQRLAAILSAEETARADRFVEDVHRRRYVTGRGLLRLALSRRTGDAPQAIRIETGPQGKPQVPGAIHFNVSHCGDQALFAFADAPIGVDIERIAPVAEDVARLAFTDRETAALEALPAPDRWPLFFRLWTLKEATLKALGPGLSVPMTEIEVDPGLEAAPRLRRCGFAPDAPGRVSLLAFERPTPDGAAMACAIAVLGGGAHLPVLVRNRTAPCVAARDGRPGMPL